MKLRIQLLLILVFGALIAFLLPIAITTIHVVEIPTVVESLGWIALALAALVVGSNLCVGIGRYLLYKLMKWPDPDHHISGVPLFGSVFAAVALACLWQFSWVRWTGLVLLVIDTSGIVWIIIAISPQIYAEWRDKRRAKARDKMPPHSHY